MGGVSCLQQVQQVPDAYQRGGIVSEFKDRSVSRREFLKIAGLAGATVGVGAGLGGLLAACGGEAETTTTAGGTGTTAPGGTGTTVVDAVELGEEVKAGYVIPITGNMAAFGVAASWHIDYFNKNIWKDGLVMGDGKKHKFTVIAQDMQSDSNRAAQVAGDLIQNAGVQLMGASASAANVVPVRDTCEAMECPCVTYDCPGDAWNAGQPEGGYKWSWHTWFIFKDLAANFIAMWDMIPTNKKVGGLYPNDADGQAFSGGLPAAFQAMGYSYVDPGRYENNTEDYTAIISKFRSEGVEIVNGVPTPPDFSNFWKQAVQQGFRPKISTEAKAMLFPDGVNALGELGDGQTVECWFHNTYPVRERPHRVEGSGHLRHVGVRHRHAVDAAPLLLRAVRGLDRHHEAVHQPARQARHHRGHQADQRHDHRRTGQLDGQSRAVLGLEQLLHQGHDRAASGSRAQASGLMTWRS